VRKYQDRVTGAWGKFCKNKRRVDVSYDLSMVTAPQHSTWMDEESFKKICIKEKGKRVDIYQPLLGT